MGTYLRCQLLYLCRGVDVKTRLRYLPLSDVTEGMVLGSQLVLSEHGVSNFSLPAGHVLTESNLRQIALRHGDYACIAQPDARTDEEVAQDKQRVSERLDEIFQKADRSKAAVAGIYAAVLAYRSM